MGEQRSTISSSASQLSQMGSHRDALLFRNPAHMRSASCSACAASIELPSHKVGVSELCKRSAKHLRARWKHRAAGRELLLLEPNGATTTVSAP